MRTQLPMASNYNHLGFITDPPFAYLSCYPCIDVCVSAHTSRHLHGHGWEQRGVVVS